MAPIDSFPQLNLEAALVFLAAFVVAILLSLPSLLGYPLFRLTIIVHELGHVVATLISGGRSEWFRVYYGSKDGARGVAKREGGKAYLVLPAGYVGVAIFSAGLILLTGLPYHAPFTLIVVAIILMLFTLSLGREMSTWLLVFGISAGLILVAIFADLVWSFFLLSVVAIYTGISSIIQLIELRRIIYHIPDEEEGGDDASKMAKVMGCTPIFWTEVWLLFSITILGAAFWFTWIRNISA
ncbi:MAG: M50 family metallopeptidase [Anaerolineae bacterium]|nr:M50 family metallopeptidase [Anaerolineae bacterium]